MKRILTIFLIAISAIGAYAKAFDSVFSTFRKVNGADYVKIPGLLVRLGAMKVSQISGMDDSDIPMNLKVTGLRVLDMSECKKSKSDFISAVNAAGKNCELMLEAKDGKDKVTIWVEPKGAKSFSKMIIFDEEDSTIIELSGKFTPK